MQRNVQNSFEQNTISEIDGILDSDDIQAEVHESYSESDFESDDDNNHEKLEESSKFFQKSRRLSKSEPMLFQANENNGENYRNDFEEDSPQFCYVPESSKSEFPVPKITDSGLSYCEKINSTASMEYSRLLIVRIRSLCKIYCLNIPHNSTIKDLVNVIWDEIPFEEERYTMDSHVLLLFNHRLHIFIESNPSELVKDFLQLSPDDSVTDFYAYGLPIEHRDFMYNFDTGHNSLFKVSDSWDPVYFTDYKQLERSQSTLLSSLYALALYFRCNNRESAGYRRAMEAQFFLQLRKYLYPPAVLAFKHTIEGSMFWFEKTLLMDALIQLLIRLCPKIVCEIPIDSTEYFDFIPLLFCWLLEKCDPNEVEEDFFAVVKLTDIRRDEHFYFQDPVTTSDINCQKLILEEFSETQSHDKLTRHVDLRSFNRYLASPANHSPNLVFTHKEYEIYHPSTDISSEFNELPCWTENEIYRYNKIMSRKYPSLTIITRGALTARISNQLVLLNKERTVSLLFSRQNKTTENKGQQHNINHFFQIFDPLDASNESSLVTVESFLDEQQNWPDPRLPIYFSNNVITQPNNVPFFETNTIKPAEQVTVVLLDLSRSMFDHNVGDDDRTGKCTHINMCKMMLGTLSDNMLPKDEVHAFGLIEFGERVKVTCPITRDRNKFEKALQSHMLLGEWTHMYDAVNEAVRKINVYINSPLRAGKNCRKLIICLSDGVNNAGPTTIESLYKQIEEHNIVIDFVSFLRDDQLNDEKKNNSIRNFRQLCIKSGGYVYSKLHYRSKIEVAGMFEQEAAVWLSKRARESRGVVEKPERHVNPIFQRLAVRQVSNNTNTQNSSRLVRVFKELTVTQSHSSNEFFVFSILDNISFWKVILKGPQQTPYENKYWMIYVSFDSGYPSYPPNVRFMTPIYHVNISGDGKICHQIFNESWAEPTKMTTYDEMKSALKISEDSTEHGDMILFYFAGHGVQWQESNYLLPQDVPHLANVDLNKNAFNAQEYLYALGERKPSTTVFLLDCCRSYHISVSELGEQALNQSDSRLDHFKPMHMPGSLIAFACAPGAGASDGNGHENGLFTKHLLRHITTPNEDIQLILRDVRREVMQESKSKQIPFLSDGLLERNICLYGQSRYKARDFLQISDDDLKLHENIGDGAFGIVYRATWLSTSHIVAVKKLHVNEFSDKATREFFQELSLLHTLRSPYIVNFYGACMEKGKYALVMEYMSLGSLYKMVHEDKLALTWAERLSIALQAAKGINYLHQLQEPIIHRDIKSLNLLLERAYEGYIVKVCDFGVARTLNETARQTNYKPTRVITLPWSAPEILRVEQHTKKSDIYSLGTIYWELAAFNKPYEGHADDVIRASVLAGDRLRIPENTPSRFCAVIKKCWAQNPQDRPSSSEIIQMIEQCIPIE
ncbi:unnamed protein product, partial [Rotaria socialis]